MKKKICFCLLFMCLILNSQINDNHVKKNDSLFDSKAEIKLNILSALVMIPNIGIEVKVSDKLGYQLDTTALSYDSMDGSPVHVTQIFNELRFYPRLKSNKNHRSFYIGAHWGYGMFTLRLPKFITSFVDSAPKDEGSYQSGRNTYYGITFGKKIPLKSNKFNIELFIGGGSSQSYYKNYNKFENRIYENPDSRKIFNNSGEELIYRGGVMLSYRL